MVKNHGSVAIKTPFLLRMKLIVQQLLMNAFEVNYWHQINQGTDNMWKISPDDVFKKLFANALFVKTHCNEKCDADMFRAYAIHNYPDLIQT